MTTAPKYTIIPEANDVILYENERTRVFRRILEDGQSLVIKQPLGVSATDRLRHEKRILARLEGVEGVAQIATAVDPVNAIAFEDNRSVSLAEVMTSETLGVATLLKLALDLARILANVHRSGVIHKDINPSNILFDSKRQAPALIDFDLATTFNEENQDFTQARQLAGTLAYLAPEQTGRTGRVVDQRTDLYSLGSLFYELATDSTPFRGDDVLEVVHDILAKAPTPVADLNGGVPRPFSDIVMRLLAKEPNQRYQSAHGLAYDLSLLINRCATVRSGEEVDGFELGQRDFPQKLLPPSRLIGREKALVSLNMAFKQAIREGEGLLVSGDMGVGKTALVNELRRVAADRNGWLVTAGFDQFHNDEKTNGISNITREVARMMLTLPQAELERRAGELRDRMGDMAKIAAGTIPELVRILEVTPEIVSSDPRQFVQKLKQAVVDIFLVNASPANPLVAVLENLQWANLQQLVFFEYLFSCYTPGLLVVGTYREKEAEENPAFAPMLRRLEENGQPPRIPLGNLSTDQLDLLIEEVLRLPHEQSAKLAGILAAHTGGNPYDTLSLINSLRHLGLLEVSEDTWHWDEKKLRQFVSQGTVATFRKARIDILPEDSRELLGYISCLGNKCPLGVLSTATGIEIAALEPILLPILEDGLLVSGDQVQQTRDWTILFHNNQVEMLVHQQLDPEKRRQLHWEIARRLINQPEYSSQAAEQYLAALDLVTAEEADRVVEIFEDAANDAWNIAYYAGVEQFLQPAIALLKKFRGGERNRLLRLATRLHHALYHLGNHAGVDAAYRDLLECSSDDPLLHVDTTCVQITSLSNRGKIEPAAAMALDMLAQLGLEVPDAPDNYVREGLDRLMAEFGEFSKGGSRAALSDPKYQAQAKLLEVFIPVAYVSNPTLYAWAALESKRIWDERGAHSALMSGLGTLAVILISARSEYFIAHRIYQWVIEAGEALGFKVETARARGFMTVFTNHWFNPLEDNLRVASDAMAELVQEGDVQNASYVSVSKICALVDCGRTIAGTLDEIESDMELSNRIGSQYSISIQVPARQFLKSLCDGTDSPGVFTDSAFNMETYLEQAKHPFALTCLHVYRAITALMFDDEAAFDRHTASAEALLPVVSGLYLRALVYVLRAIALTQKIKAGDPEQDKLIGELNTCYLWLEQRADEATANFSHLALWVSAEAAWALGKEQQAVREFDRTMLLVNEQARPWHKALITERAGELFLELGLDHTAQVLLGDARRLYEAWGASGKVRALAEKHPFLKAPVRTRRKEEKRLQSQPGSTSTGKDSLSGDGIDLLGILRASQALSSATSLSGLRLVMNDLLLDLTGATNLLGVFWNQDIQEWQMPAKTGGLPARVAPETHAERIPFSVFHYIDRTRQPLVVNNVVFDDRFNRDPYFAGVTTCSLLGLPVFNKERLRLILIFENRLSFGAFSEDRLETIELIAGQLAISIDNAMLYDSLERKVVERTEALKEANRKLESLSLTDPLTGLANRRRFDETLNAEWRRCLRTNIPLGMVIIDIDEFKKYNDHYGHQSGDECLSMVAGILSQSIRSDTDLIARFGGEEFVYILPGADAGTACEVAERARALVEARHKPHQKSDAGFVTISLGVASLIPSAGETPEKLITLADAALYKAKGMGKNQVVRG